MWPVAFRHFNPLEERLSRHTETQFVIDEALRYLTARNFEELSEGLEFLLKLRRKFNFSTFLQARERLAATGDEATIVLNTDMLREAKTKHNLSEDAPFPDAQWSEVFALWALAEVAEVISTIRSNSKEADSLMENNSLLKDAQFQAMDALKEAMLARHGELAAEERKARSKKGGIARTQGFRELKKVVCRLYDEKYSTRSARNAAQRIWKEDLSEEQRATFSSSTPEETIEKWLAEHRRKKKSA